MWQPDSFPASLHRIRSGYTSAYIGGGNDFSSIALRNMLHRQRLLRSSWIFTSSSRNTQMDTFENPMNIIFALLVMWKKKLSSSIASGLQSVHGHSDVCPVQNLFHWMGRLSRKSQVCCGAVYHPHYIPRSPSAVGLRFRGSVPNFPMWMLVFKDERGEQTSFW